MSGEVVVVTGAAGGIGGCITEAAQKCGWLVVGIDAQAPDVATSLANEFVVGDVADAQVLREAVTVAGHLGELRGWVNNAAVFPSGPTHLLELSELRRVFDVNVFAAILGMGVAASHWSAVGGRGSIVNVSSVQATRAFPEMCAYSASKAALEAATRVAAVEYGAVGIRANAVAPGTIITPAFADSLDALPPDEGRAVRAYWGTHHALRRTGAPQEVANAVTFLISDAASFISGHVLAVDGGWGASAQAHLGRKEGGR